MRLDGLKEIGIYISRQKNMEVQYITACPVMDLCLDTDRNPESWVPKWWWDKEGLVLPVI